MSVRDFPDIPPVWAAGCFAAQFALSLLPGPAPRAAPLGWALIAVGLVLIAWSAWWFWRKSTSIEPREVPRRLIVEGPFRLNRNPIYTGMARSPMVTTDAPIIPVQAPNRVETTTTATAIPPLTGPKR